MRWVQCLQNPGTFTKWMEERPVTTTTLVGLGIAAVVIVLIAVFLGSFVKLAVAERRLGPFTIAYRALTPVQAATQMTASLNIRLLLKKFGVRDCRQFIVFPSKIDDANAVSKFGWAVPAQYRGRLHKIPNVAIEHLPACQCMVIYFPRGGMLASSVGFLRARRLFERHRRTHGYRSTQIYIERLGTQTLFAQPIQHSTFEERAAEEQ